jgi:anti-anti-sigma factor
MNQTSFPPDFTVAIARRGPGGAGIDVRGELDRATCEELLAAFRQVVAEAGTVELTLDLRGVSFIDSAGTRAVILIERLAREHGVELRVTPPPNEVTALLRTAGVIERFELSLKAPQMDTRGTELLERVELDLPRSPQSPARARVEIRELMAGGDQSQVANLVLLTSELVTNAVVHPRGVAQTSIGLRISSFDDHVRVEVEDAGDGFKPSVPVRPEGERGRGLFLVDRFASRWGTARVKTGAGSRFRVWFELDWLGPGAVAPEGD